MTLLQRVKHMTFELTKRKAKTAHGILKPNCSTFLVSHHHSYINQQNYSLSFTMVSADVHCKQFQYGLQKNIFFGSNKRTIRIIQVILFTTTCISIIMHVSVCQWQRGFFRTFCTRGFGQPDYCLNPLMGLVQRCHVFSVRQILC